MTHLLSDPNFGTNLVAIGTLVGALVGAGISVATFIRSGRNSRKLDEHTEALEDLRCNSKKDA